MEKLKLLQDENGVFLVDQNGHKFENVIVSELNQDQEADHTTGTLGPGNLVLSFSSLEYSLAKSN